jgi:hypothetical protein
MSARRKKAVSLPDSLARMAQLPPELRVGMCFEIYSPETHHIINTWCGYNAAVEKWLRANGFRMSDPNSWPPPLSENCPPWNTGPFSLAEMRRDDPEGAVTYLAERGLPADWEPRPQP